MYGGTIFVLLALVRCSAQWTWSCQSDLCVRNERNVRGYGSIEACRLVCGPDSALWPLPTGKFVKSKEIVGVDVSNIHFTTNAPSTIHELLEANFEIFRRNVELECGAGCPSSPGNLIEVSVTVHSENLTLAWDTDESYKINSTGQLWNIEAQTFYGARNALETFSQLFAGEPLNGTTRLVMLKSADIEDRPAYPHRSLLLDTARNYLPLKTMKRQIDAMAASKLNVLHWHATDSQSFPYVSEHVPNLSIFGAYSEQKVYTPTDVQELLNYARVRGIRVIIEIDAPAHAGNGWQWGPEAGLGNLGVCINQKPWRSFCIQPPCGQLNPANRNVYEVLRSLYGDIVGQFPKDEVFHMGGDEVFLPCWNSSQEIVDYLKSTNRGQSTEDLLDLWGEFQSKALEKFDDVVGHHDTPILLWSSELTNPDIIEKYLDKNRYVIETWVPSTDPLPQSLLQKGYRLIVSTKNAWYLDHGFWGVTKYYTWRTAYSNSIPRHKNVLGGEVCMWGELVDDKGIDSKVWPRAAAAAERLWTNPTSDTRAAEPRMYRHRTRLSTRGIDVETLAPQWCTQNEGQCL